MFPRGTKNLGVKYRFLIENLETLSDGYTNRPKKSTDVIKGSNNEDSTLTEGTLFYDVRFDAIAPKSADSAEQEEVIRLIINVEAQTKFKPG